jgi:hypothetical protein
MKKLVFCVLLSASAATVPGTPPGSYPPDGAILLQRQSQVTLRWQLPRGEVFAELWSEGNKVLETPLREGSWNVSVERGKAYGWILRTPQGVHSQGSFSVAKDLSFSANGRDGPAGRPGPAGAPGQPGTNGGQVEAELRRDGAGMHLRIHTQGQEAHYLFAEPGVKFKLSAKGGNGGRGANGDDFRGYDSAVGRDGGPAGWGGNLKVTTYDAPWRDYLDVDLTAGQPGAPGKGGKYYTSDSTVSTAPDGRPGKAGQGGRVDTRLGQEGHCPAVSLFEQVAR